MDVVIFTAVTSVAYSRQYTIDEMAIHLASMDREMGTSYLSKK